MTPTLVFDIETIPDTTGLRALLDAPADALDNASDEDIANIAFHQRRQHNGSDARRICPPIPEGMPADFQITGREQVDGQFTRHRKLLSDASRSVQLSR